MEQKYVIGIDLGGQTAKIGIVNRMGQVVNQSSIKSNTQDSAEEFIQDLVKGIHQLVDENISMQEVKGIGVGAPNGNFYEGTIENAPNIAWAHGVTVPFADMLSQYMHCPVQLTNDANAAAMGEMTYGVAKGMKNFIMITLGTGVGSGIVIDGKVVYGHDGFAGELGHVTIVKNGRLCGCGRKGCLETYTSATGVARTARETLESTNHESLLRSLSVQNITSKDVYDAATKGDVVAIDIFNKTGEILGEALANIVPFSAPEAFVLFGGLTKAGDLIYNPIHMSMEANIHNLWRGKVKLIFSELKDSDAAILGASALAW